MHSQRSAGVGERPARGIAMRCGRCSRSLLSIAHSNRLSAPAPAGGFLWRAVPRAAQPADAIAHAPSRVQVLPDVRFQAAIDLAAAGLEYAEAMLPEGRGAACGFGW